MTRIKWGIIGPGSIATTFATALEQSKQGQLYGIASRSAERATAFSQRFAVSKIYHQYSDLITDPEVDILYIATPHSHHYQIAKACLEAGKHILLEKPLTINASQTQVLIELSQSKGLVFQEALWSRFMPCFAKVKDWLKAGKIGALQYIQSDIGFAFADKPQHRLNDPLLAGGALLDLGVYSISISQFLLEQTPIQVQATSQLAANGIDKTTQVNMRFAQGQLSQFSCSITAKCTNTMTLVGEQGRIHLPEHFWVGQEAQLFQDGELVECARFTHPVNGFEYQIEAAMQCIFQGKVCSDLMPHADSLDVMRVMDEVRKQINLRYHDDIENI
ncbi:Gfo/Idh/MocA family protein [Paraglaciecola sp.]|uniref:Gfo/Idh/MocA family protein n=1 Tax=Paraglaciecola sp. TaxID=1920173 RepID=UPI00273F20EF|nr:Gfo/Idh/MocA family oxidoreductase [Paraglaciecola sp.]MDP5030023.1 Gfo/Idh/MocA family oxidoreductase [Paraglaciecola sp.]